MKNSWNFQSKALFMSSVKQKPTFLLKKVTFNQMEYSFLEKKKKFQDILSKFQDFPHFLKRKLIIVSYLQKNIKNQEQK